jgi:hypothetical protein
VNGSLYIDIGASDIELPTFLFKIAPSLYISSSDFIFINLFYMLQMCVEYVPCCLLMTCNFIFTGHGFCSSVYFFIFMLSTQN